MIPISKDQVLTWTDDDGVVFDIRPATGRDEFDLIEAVEKIAFDPAPFLAQAEKDVDKKLTGKKRDEAVRAQAYKIAGKDKFNREEMELMYRAIDSLVISCTLKSKEKITFQNDASNRFNRMKNTQLFWGVYRANALTGEERKN